MVDRPALPAWVRKRDGRLVPFEADRISRSLFAATEEIGHPDAFLARELTDGVVHFLQAEADETIPTTSRISDIVITVVRELGHPALARAYADGPRQARPEPALTPAENNTPANLVASVLCSYSRKHVYARDLVAAHDEGLLTLVGLENPQTLESAAIEWPEPTFLLERLLETAQITRNVLTLEGAEYLLLRSENNRFVRDLAAGLRATRLRAVVNLNCATPPSWANDVAEGPLFAPQRTPDDALRLAATSEHLLAELTEAPLSPGRVRIDWHLSGRDMDLIGADRLTAVCRRAVDHAHLAFVFDRPRRPVALGDGLNRQHSAVLLMVGLHLARLATLPGVDGSPDCFLQKLGSLARLALSAAVQKREHLRRSVAVLSRGFRLERARLVVAPIGLDVITCQLGGTELARQTVQRLRDVLRQDGRSCLIETCVDGPGDFQLQGSLESSEAMAAGLTTWNSAVPIRNQMRSAGSWHAVAEGGTAAVLLSSEQALSADQIAEGLRWAWTHTDLHRVRFVRTLSSPQQLPLPHAGAA